MLSGRLKPDGSIEFPERNCLAAAANRAGTTPEPGEIWLKFSSVSTNWFPEFTGLPFPSVRPLVVGSNDCPFV